MRLAALLVAVVLSAGVLWLAGEQHRKNCISSGHSGCSVLPWDNGNPPQALQPGDVRPENINRFYCLRLNRARRNAGALDKDLLDCSRSPAH
jgi:hypothetical protein